MKSKKLLDSICYGQSMRGNVDYLNLCTTAITILAINTKMITGASSIAEANVFVTFVVAVASEAAVGVGSAVLTWS